MKKQNRFIFLSILSVLMISVTSCMKDDDSEKRENEKRLINNYVQANNITVTPTNSGLYVIPQVEGTGATPRSTDFAVIEYNAFDLEGKFFDGTNLTLATQAKVNTYFALGGPFKIYMGQGFFLDGVTEGLKQMKEGGEAKMIMPSLLAYNDYLPKIINVKLIKVITDPLAYEKGQIENFLDTVTMPEPRLEVKDSTGSGIYHIVRTVGNGITKPFNGKTAKIKFTGSLIDGRVFAKTAKDTVFKFRVGTESVIKGLDEGVRAMSKGGKSTFVIPYYMGFEFSPVTSGGRLIIPFFSTVVYDVELVDVTD